MYFIVFHLTLLSVTSKIRRAKTNRVLQAARYKIPCCWLNKLKDACRNRLTYKRSHLQAVLVKIKSIHFQCTIHYTQGAYIIRTMMADIHPTKAQKCSAEYGQ